MKKFLKVAVLGIMAFMFMILPAYSKTEKLSKETKTMLIEKLKTSTLVVYNKDGETETFEERGLLPPLNYLDKDNFKGKYIFDRTVGRAAAYLYVYGDAEYVYRFVPEDVAYGDSFDVPYFINTLEEGTYCGRSKSKKQFNSACYIHSD